MNKNLKVSKSIEINAAPDKVWDALTNPDKIKIYLYGTETITDWNVGSPIIFQGEYEGQSYKDKGNVLKKKLNSFLKYNYWSGFSGIEDIPEHYSIISYTIDPLENKGVTLTWTQEGFASEQGQQHAASGLYGMLEQIKKLVEEGW